MGVCCSVLLGYWVYLGMVPSFVTGVNQPHFPVTGWNYARNIMTTVSQFLSVLAVQAFCILCRHPSSQTQGTSTCCTGTLIPHQVAGVGEVYRLAFVSAALIDG